MVIHRVRNDIRLPVVGKIRLGTKQIAQNGKERPVDKEYFILKDEDGCEPIRKVYGDEPDFLDIMFTSDDPDQIIPTWFKLYGAGRKNSDGEMIGGNLKCYGTGMDGDQPGTAHWVEKRDHLTGVIPKRPCLEQNCPDYKDFRGIQVCKQTMSVFAMLPLVRHDGVYQIDTRSWYSIYDFERVIRLQNSIYQSVAGRPFKIIRKETATSYYDNQGNQRQGVHHIMYLESNPEFIDKHGAKVAALMESCKRSTFLKLPSQEELLQIQGTMAGVLPPAEVDPQDSAKSAAEALLFDVEVKAAFDAYENALGKPMPDKERLIKIRKKEGCTDVKGEVLKAIVSAIEFLKNKSMEKAPPAQAEATPEPPSEVIESDIPAVQHMEGKHLEGIM